jgi:peptidoglycan/LPS O-acetylase OafA/YrhL
MFGVLLSYWWHFYDLGLRMRSIPSVLLIGLGFILLWPAFVFPLEQYMAVSVFGVVGFYLGSGLLVLAAVRLQQSRSRFMSFCAALGAASYSIYLWHLPWALWGWSAFRHFFATGGETIYFWFYMVGSLAFGWMMNKFVEGPVLALRDRLFPRSADRWLLQKPIIPTAT